MWYYLNQMKSPVASNYWFCLLFNVVCLLWVMPHSDAGIEHMYALANKNKLMVQIEIGWISKGFYLQSLQSSLLDQKFSWSATTLNLMKRFCMMLKKQQESITHCTLQFFKYHNTAINIIFWTLYWLKTSLWLSNQLSTRQLISQSES